MRMLPLHGAVALGAAVFGVGVTGVAAQDGMITRGYVLTPKPGMEAQFVAALRAHAEWRKANRDPWTWAIYTPVTGELGTYVVRSGRHTWAELDAYEQGFGTKAGEKFIADVTPLIASTRSVIDVALPDSISKRPPPDQPIKLVNVTTFLVRPGMEQQFMQLIGQASMALKAANWPPNWGWFMPYSGAPETGPVVYLAGFNQNWSSMKDPDPGFDTVLSKALGRDGFMKWVEAFNQTTRGMRSVIYQYHPELSVTTP